MAASAWENVRKLVFKQGFGVYLDGNDVFIARVGFSLFGPVLQSTSHQRLAPGHHAGSGEGGDASLSGAQSPEDADQPAWKRVLGWLRRMISEIPVVLEAGVPDHSVFYSAVPATSMPSQQSDLNAIISDYPKASFLAAPDLVADWTGVAMEDRIFLLLGGAKKSVVEGLLNELYELNLKPIRVEAAPWAALRAAWHQSPPRAAAELEIRILLGKGQALVALSQSRVPLAWNSVSLSEDKGLEALYSAIQGLMVYARWKLRATGVREIVFQGPSTPPAWCEAIHEKTRIAARAVEGPLYDGNLVAYGLALGAVAVDARALNLARTVQKPVPLVSMLPRLEAGLALVAVLAVLGSMAVRITSLSGKVNRLKRQNAEAGWAIGKNAFLLNLINQRLLKEARPLADYVGDRVLWSDVLEEVARILPSNARLSQIQADDRVWSKNTANKDLGERFMNIRFAVEFNEGGRVPQEIDRFVQALRDSPIISKQFAKVQLLSITWRKEHNAEMAYAAVTCTPRQPKQAPWEEMMNEQLVAKQGGGGGG